MDSKKIFELKQKIQDLLRERPELKPLQDKIDETLRGAGSQHNRAVLIHRMMLDSVMQLNEKLKELVALAPRH